MTKEKEIDVLPEVRVDKWLWAVRICKTRTLAMDLCKRGKVLIDGQSTKPSRSLREGCLVSVKKDGIQWRFKVTKCIDKRVSAPMASHCKEDVTPKEEVEKQQLIRRSWTPRRPKGMGRPTKKDRRAMDKLKGS